MYCSNCGNYVDDRAGVCPHCGNVFPGAEAQTAQPVYDAQPQPVYDAQPTYQQPTYQQPQYQAPQPTYQQPVYNGYQSSSAAGNAKTLGIISIIAGLFIPLAGWICGGIGMSKANAALALNPADMEASSAKKLCTAGIVVACVSFAINLLIVIGSMVAGYSYY